MIKLSVIGKGREAFIVNGCEAWDGLDLRDSENYSKTQSLVNAIAIEISVKLVTSFSNI